MRQTLCVLAGPSESASASGELPMALPRRGSIALLDSGAPVEAGALVGAVSAVVREVLSVLDDPCTVARFTLRCGPRLVDGSAAVLVAFEVIGEVAAARVVRVFRGVESDGEWMSVVVRLCALGLVESVAEWLVRRPVASVSVEVPERLLALVGGMHGRAAFVRMWSTCSHSDALLVRRPWVVEMLAAVSMEVGEQSFVVASDASKGAARKGVAAWVSQEGVFATREVSGSVADIESHAVAMAARHLCARRAGRGVVLTDSQAAVAAWRAVVETDGAPGERWRLGTEARSAMVRAWAALRAERVAPPAVRWVRGHAGHPLNEAADAVSRNARFMKGRSPELLQRIASEGAARWREGACAA